MARRVLIVSSLFLLVASWCEAGADPPDKPLCLPESRCGFSLGVEIDVEELLVERQLLKARFVEHPDDVETIKALASNLGSYSVEILQEDGSVVADGAVDEYRALMRRLRRLEPDYRDAWCRDLDSPATLDEALQLVAREPAHWLVTECLAEYLANNSREALASELLDIYLAASGIEDFVERSAVGDSRGCSCSMGHQIVDAG